jgi:hypothetical protein
MYMTCNRGVSTTRLLAPSAVHRGGVLHDALLQSADSLSRQGLSLFHALIGAAALAVPSK